MILNYIDEEHITFKQYNDELKKHDKKILAALNVEHYNVIEVLNLGFREAFLEELKSTEPKKIDVKKISDVRLDNIYVDYNFINDVWKRPKKDMKQNALNIIIKSFYAYKYFLNECKTRGVRLRR